MVEQLPLTRMQIQALLLPASCLLPLLWLTSPPSLGRSPFHSHHCCPPLQVLGLDRQSGQVEELEVRLICAADGHVNSLSSHAQGPGSCLLPASTALLEAGGSQSTRGP